jgi:pyruvate dehydrogenase E2 component (dihydrolipoamide acetyltransferase)
MAAEIILPQLGMLQTEARLERWLRSEGDTVVKGEPVAVIETDKATVEIEAPAGGTLAGIRLNPDESAAVGSVIAYILQPGEEVPPTVSPGAPEGAAPSPPAEVRASPGVRKLARDLDVDIAAIARAVQGARITEAEIRAAALAEGKSPQADGTERTLSRARQATALRMAESFRAAPHFFVETSLDASAIVACAKGGISVTDVILHATANTLRVHPGLNATFRDGRVFEFKRVNLGIAVDTDDGLYVPVLPDADALDLRELSAHRAALVDRARHRSFSTSDLVDATFTVSNLGTFKVDAAWAILNPPGVAILAVGRIRPQPLVIDGEVTVRPALRLVLTADHRAVDGAEAARFLGELGTRLEQVKQ